MSGGYNMAWREHKNKHKEIYPNCPFCVEGMKRIKPTPKKIEKIAVEQFNRVECVMTELQWRALTWDKLNEVIDKINGV